MRTSSQQMRGMTLPDPASMMTKRRTQAEALHNYLNSVGCVVVFLVFSWPLILYLMSETPQTIVS